MTDSNYEADIKKYGEEKAKKIHELQAVIATELQKGEDEMNTDLIRECVDWCLELKGIDINPTDDELQEMYIRCVDSAKSQQKRPVRPVKRTVIAILAAALLVAAMCITAVGIGGPFDSFTDNIKNLFGIKPGDVISTAEGELTADKGYKHYNDILDFYNDTSINILYPDGLLLESEKSILYYRDSTTQSLMIKGASNVSITVFLTSPPYEEKALSTNGDIEQKTINDRIFYLVNYEQEKQLVLFDGDYVYVIKAPDAGSLTETANRLKMIKEN